MQFIFIRKLKQMICLVLLVLLGASSAALAETTAHREVTDANAVQEAGPAETGSSQDMQVYTDGARGYQLQLPAEAVIDTAKGEVFTSVTWPGHALKIFYDDFTTQPGVTVNNLMQYGDRNLETSGRFHVTDRYKLSLDGRGAAQVTVYARGILSKIEGDLPYYTSIVCPRGNKEAVTLLLKSSQPLTPAEIRGWPRRLTWIPRTGVAPMFKDQEQPLYKHLNADTRAFLENNFGANASLRFGIYHASVENTSLRTVDTSQLRQLEDQLGYRFPLLLSYSTTTVFQDGFGALKQNLLQAAAAEDRTLLLTLTTFENGPDIARQSDCTLDLLQGKYDGVLAQYAQAFKDYRRPVLLRINNEMNGDWVMYCNQFLGKDPDLYVAAYRYIHDFFTQAGADNVIYVFNPNEKSFPAFSYNHYLAYYPGRNYVDLIGLTAYNTGSYYPGESWRTFSEMYARLYNDYARCFPQPFIITEFSSAEIGGNKVAWIRDMFQIIKAYDRIKLAVLWNGTDWDQRDGVTVAARQYRLDTDQDLLQVLRQGLADCPQAFISAPEPDVEPQGR